jgi:preprotein translocase subunit SecE
VARNRKRAKERRARRPQPVPSRRSERDLDDAPDPIAHATPDVELAEAQMALGRPELADDSVPGREPEPDDNEPEFEELDANGSGRDGSGGATLVPAGGPTPAPPERARPANRLINFLQGSWRELQRVQWPDRRQVMQATGVVVGFVIVAGLFLGVADWAAGKLVNYILTGHG